MASLITRDGSRFWWIAYRDPLTQKRVQKPTHYRRDSRADTRLANELRAQKTYEEKKAPRSHVRGEQWPSWVRDYLEQRYYNQEETRDRNLTIWRNIEAFLHSVGAMTPAQVTRDVALGYVKHRRAAGRAPGTIVLEMKTLRGVMDEAIRRGYAVTNSCVKLGLSRKPLRELREIRPEEDQIIRDALRTAPVWMQRSYEIAMAHGCRFSATRLNMRRDINLTHGKVLFHEKGGKVFEVDLNPSLRPLLECLKRAGEEWTWDLPAKEMKQTGRNWTRFFDKLGFDDLWFHCTRATAITRAHRAGVKLPAAMRYFGHSGKTLVHFIYSRLGTEDTSEVAAALAAYPSFSSESSGVPRYSPSSESPGAAPAKRAPRPSSPARHKQTRTVRPDGGASRSRSAEARRAPLRAVSR